MRQEYIDTIKEYVRLKSEGEHTVEQLKQNVIGNGATNEEFNEAVRQIVAEREVFIPKQKNEAIFYKSKKLIFSLSIILILFFGFLVFNNPAQEPLIVSKLINPVQITKIKNESPVTQVYANFKEIDPQKAFIPPKPNAPLIVTSKPKKEVLGFFPYWMLTKAQDINLNVLTSISIFALETDGKGEIVTVNSETSEVDPGWQMWKDPKLDSFIRKARGEGLKIFLTFKSFNNANIENLVQSDGAQKAFISNALYLVNSKNLDGINLDFEYSGTPTDQTREGFTRFVTNLNSELKRQIPKSALTIDTYITSGSVRDLFDIQLLSRIVDAFVIMGYDMHYALGSPGPISPMGGDVNIIGLVQGYLEKAKPEKLILAVPYYGYDWPINPDSSSDTPGAAIISYAELAELSKKYKLIWNDTSQTPSYTYTNRGIQHEVHFENVRSLAIKYDYVVNKNLKGIGIWALGYDGYRSDLQRLIIDKL